MKNVIFGFFVLTFLISTPISARAYSKTFTADKTQVTFSELKETEPVIFVDTVYYRKWYSGTHEDIWVKNLKTGQESALIERDGEKIPVAANNKYLVYNQYIDTANWYDIYLYNLKTGEDTLIAGGPENQVVQDMDDNLIIFNTGFTWPDLYTYNIRTGETEFIANEAIRPKISGDIIVWIHSFGFGYATVWSYDLKTGETVQVPLSVERNETWPDIYKDGVVWQGAGIYYKNLKTDEELKISDTGENPVIYGNFIAWVDALNIYAYDLKTAQTIQITNDNASLNPYIYKDTLVWQDGVSGQFDIWSANLVRQ